MTPQGIAIIAVFCVIVAAVIYDRNKLKKAGADYEAKYAGRHTNGTDSAFGPYFFSCRSCFAGKGVVALNQYKQ